MNHPPPRPGDSPNRGELPPFIGATSTVTLCQILLWAIGMVWCTSTPPMSAILWDQLEMAGEIFWLTGIQRQADQPDELVAITETGVVRLFQKQVNRAPLLFNSLAEANEAGYSLNISVINIEENEVVGIRLEVFDPVSNTWVSQGEQTAQRNDFFWLIEPPATTAGVQYRFIYHDDVHSGLVEPMVGPPPLVVQREDRTGMWVLAGVLVTLLVGFGGAFMRRTWQPDVRARRFYSALTATAGCHS